MNLERCDSGASDLPIAKNLLMILVEGVLTLNGNEAIAPWRMVAPRAQHRPYGLAILYLPEAGGHF
jgi:hypothetical protein